PLSDPFLQKAQIPNGSWEAIVTEILTANDPKIAAKESIKRTTTQPTYDSLEVPLVFLDLLKRELSSLDTETIIVLGALEKQLLTVEDLAYAVGMPVERVRAIVHELWKDGYIDSKKSNLLEKIASVFKSKPTDPNVKNDASFNVTTKGHFRLHPLVKDKQRAGVIR
ncbi:MAG: Rrf2 family transcriptional regulator, partial [Leptolyngbyaceae cyanobacterium SL_7_1]|nr:Rrf2 family transcriptional regulator [Leptolyngbyaceae cyanobacterium SL_7_1]